MPYQPCPHGMCKILWLLNIQKLNYDKISFPIDLRCAPKIMCKMCLWFTQSHVRGLAGVVGNYLHRLRQILPYIIYYINEKNVKFLVRPKKPLYQLWLSLWTSWWVEMEIVYFTCTWNIIIYLSKLFVLVKPKLSKKNESTFEWRWSISIQILSCSAHLP